MILFQMTLASIRMHALLMVWVLVLCVTRIDSVTISTPAMQRKALGESCKFRWSVTGNFTTYSIKLLSSTTTTLGPNTNQTVDYSSGIIALVIRNIQTSDAGYYQLSINTGPSTDVTSFVLLFVYYTIYANAILAIGRNPGFEGDRIELNCTVTSYSLPADVRPRLYYFWIRNYVSFRNVSSGSTVLQNGDIVPGYSIKNDGKTLVIASAQPLDSSFSCSVQEENSPYKSISYNYLSLTIYGKPCTNYFTPTSKIFNAAPPVTYGYLYWYFVANPPLTSYSNWSFINAFGGTEEYPAVTNKYNYVFLAFNLYSVNQYGNYSITLTNSNGSRTEAFQILHPGPPDTPTNLSVQYLTSDFVSLQWRCMWFNGAQQTISIQLTNVATNAEVEIKNILLANTDAYNFRYSTLFRKNIQPETSYAASIWSNNSFGSSSVVSFTFTTPKRLILSVSSASILIAEDEVTINFLILNSTTTVIRLNVTCCVEITTECSNISYILANTDTQVVYDRLPIGSDYVFDFNIFDTDGYTYEYNVALVKGVRVSRTYIFIHPTIDQTTTFPFVDKENPLSAPVIVLAVLLGVAVLVLLISCIAFLVSKTRQKKSKQLQANSQTSAPTRNTPDVRDSHAEDNYEPVLEMDRSNSNAYYKALGGTSGNAKRFTDARYTIYAPEPRNDDDPRQNPYMNPDEIFHTNTGTPDLPKRNRKE